jgi:ribosomal protein S21
MSVNIKIKNPDDPKSFDRGMRMFKKLCQKQGFLQEARERRYYLKPSVKKKLKREKNKRNKRGFKR